MNEAHISVRVITPDADTDMVERMTRGLRMEMMDIGVRDVTASSATRAPDGAKSAEVIAVGALLVSLAPTVADGLMRVLESWLSRQPKNVELQIDDDRIKGSFTRKQQAQLVQAFLRRAEERR